MKRPMLYILLFFIIGIMCGQYANIALLAFVAVLSAGAVALAYGRFRFVFLVPVALVGFTVYNVATAVPNEEINAFADTDKSIRVSGVVSDVPITSSDSYGRYCFVFDGRVFDCDGKIIDESIRLRVYYGDNTSDNTYNKISVGDSLVINGKLVNPQKRTNPSEFDYGRYLLARGQRYILYAKDVKAYGSYSSLNTMLSLLRSKMCNNFYKLMPQDEASVMCTMILGDKGGLDDEIGDLYRKTGIYHVLAISGLHITLLGAIIVRALSFLGRKRAYGVAMAVLLLYCIMTGCGATVVRAVLMFYTIALGIFIGREYDVVSATAFAALALLAVNPYYLYDVGFELSFAVVFAIGAFLDVAVKYNIKGFNDIGVVVVADLASKPILMYYFYNVGIWSVVANLLLAPLMSAVVVLGFVCAFVGLVSLSLAKLVATPVILALHAIEGWCNLFVNLPFSYIITGRPHLYALLGYAVLLFVCYRLIMCGKLKTMLAFAIFAVAVLVSGMPVALRNNKCVTFLNDECAVIEDNGYCYVVDMGGDDKLSDYLMYRGIDKADGVLVMYDNESLSEGESIKITDTDKIECVYNNGSTVLRLVCGDKTVLFTGKTDNKTKKLLCNNGYALNADVLQTSSSNAELESAVAADYVIMTDKKSMQATGAVTVKLDNKISVSKYLED